MLRTVLIIALGGAIGSAFRYLTHILLQKYYYSIFPLATFVVNILGCLLIGLFVGVIEKNELANSNLKWFLITGICGGFTTFSAFGFENYTLLQNNQYGLAFLYIGSSVVLGLLAVWMGISLAK